MYEGIKVLNDGRAVNLANLPKSENGELILSGISTLKIELENGAQYNQNIQILENNADVRISLIDAEGNEFFVILKGLGQMLLTNDTEIPIFEVFDNGQSLASMTTIDDLEAAAAGGETTTSDQTANPTGGADLGGTDSGNSGARVNGLGGAGTPGAIGGLDLNATPVVEDVTLDDENEVLGVEGAGDKNTITGQLEVTDADPEDTGLHTFDYVTGTLTLVNASGVIDIVADDVEVVINPDGTYTISGDFNDLAAGESATLSFEYTATDVEGAVSDPATVTVTILGTNDIPVVEDVTLNSEDSIVIGGGTSSIVGYYDMLNEQGAPRQVDSIDNANLTAVQISDLSATELSGVDILYVQNPSNSDYSTEYLTQYSDILDAVNNGMKLIIHDRYVTDGSTILPGGQNIVFHRDFTNDTEIEITDEGSFLETGSAGTIDDTSLDGGSSSSHGYVEINSLPEGSIVLMTNGNVDQVVTFAYPYGDGMVVYSTIPLDYYLDQLDTGLYENMDIYAANLLEDIAAALNAGNLYETRDTDATDGDTIDDGNNIYTGQLSVTDDDVNDTHEFYVAADGITVIDSPVDGAGEDIITIDDLDITINTDGTYSVGGDFSELAVGETVTVSVEYYATDLTGFDGTDGVNESSESEHKTITFTITGTNDQPIVNEVVINILESDLATNPDNQTLTIDTASQYALGNYLSDDDVNDTHTFARSGTTLGLSITTSNTELLAAIATDDLTYFNSLATELFAIPEMAVALTNSADIQTFMTQLNAQSTVADAITLINSLPGVNLVQNGNLITLDIEDASLLEAEGLFALTVNADGSYELSSPLFDNFSVDENISVSFDYVADDGTNDANGESNLSDPATVTVNIQGTNDQPVVEDVTIDVLESQLTNSSDNQTLTIDVNNPNALGNYLSDDDILDSHTFARSGTILGLSISSTNADLLTAISTEDLDYIKNVLLKIASIPEIIVAMTNNINSIPIASIDAQTIIDAFVSAPDLATAIASINSDLVTLGISVELDPVTGLTVSIEDASPLETEGLLTVTVNADGSYEVTSPLFDNLGVDDNTSVSFDYVADDGTNDANGESNLSDPATVTVNIQGTNDQPVVEDVIVGGGNAQGNGTGIIDNAGGNNDFNNALNIDGTFVLDSNPDIGNAQTVPHVSINGIGDGTTDWYQFTVTNAGDTAIFDIDYGMNQGGSFDPWLDLYDTNGNLITSDDDSNISDGAGGSIHGYDSYLTYTFSTPGVYYIKVGEYSGGTAIPTGGTYTLQVSLENAIMSSEIIYESDLATDPNNVTLTVDVNDSNALGNYVSDADIADAHTFARSGTTLGLSITTANADLITAITTQDLTYVKNALDKIASIPEVASLIANNVDVQNAVNGMMNAPDFATVEAIATNAFAQLGINVSIDPVTGITLTMADASALESAGLLTVTVNADGSYEISSPLFDTLGTNDEMNITFDYVADDGTNDANGESNISDPATVSVTITGVNDAPVITTAAVVNYLETDFLDNTNAGIENYYKVLSAADVFAQLGIEDPDSVNIGLSLSNNSSSFEVNGTDITSGTTNGVFQLDQTTYDSNPGWAAMGASVGDFVIYSQEIDGLGTNDDMVASFKVRAYDGEDYSAESTVTVNISGVNDAPVITTAAVVNYLETDFLDNANAGIENYYKVLSAADVFAQLGIEDPDSVNIGLSLSNNSSSFEVNGTDITSGTTNGVFQLDQATYDSNPGWATMGASVGDFVIYSQEIDGLGTNDDMVASFKVRAYDGEDYSAESTVTVNVQGTNDQPVVEDVTLNNEDSIVIGGGTSSIVGYYDMSAEQGAPRQVDSIDNANLTAVQISDLSATELSGVDILYVQNPSNSDYSTEYLTQYSDILDAVNNGMKLIIHDRYVTDGSTILPGGQNIVFHRDFTNDTEIEITDEGSFLETGSAGTIDDTSLDGGSSSSHGYVEINSLPEGSIVLMTNGNVDQVVTFAYPYGDGMVVYSTIPLDYYLDQLDTGLYENMDIYAANLLEDIAAAVTTSKIYESDLATDPNNVTLTVDVNDSNALGNYVSDADIADAHTFARSGTTLGLSITTANADLITAITTQDLTYVKNALDKIASIPEVASLIANNVDVQNAVNGMMNAPDFATVEAIATNAFAQLGINVNIDPVTGITLTMADASVLETEGLLTVTVNADGSYEISSPLFDTLGTNDEMNITFDYVADDGTNDANGESNISDPATVSVTITGVNDAPVITTAAVVNYLETDFLDNANAGIENYYKVLSAADVFAQLGIEDPDSVNIGLSLSNNSSSFEVNGTDITSGTTNGVFQLDQTTYDSNPGWAAMGASVGDFVIYSQEIDGLGTNDDMVASFKVRAYDGEDYSAESTVTVNISGVNDAPVITTAAVVNYLETDFLDNANAGIENYYKVLSAADVFAQLGIEDPDSVNIGLSLSNNSSSFEVNGTDITTPNTNGVFQLDQTTYDSNPGWAAMGASVGDFVIYSQEIDGLGTNDDMVASFKVRAYDGEDYSAESTVTVNITGVNDAPVITTAAVVNYLETDFLDNTNAGIENYYKVLSAADVFAQLGIEDPDSVNIGLSLSNNSSSFEVNGTDITSGTTNGVFQLDQATYDSNPGWATMGASVGDFVIYSQEIDGLGTNDDMVASFKVRAYDGEDYSAESTVTVNISGVNDAPVITTAAVVNYLETDFLDNANAGIENYYKVLSAADVFAQLGIEDPDSVNIGLSLSNNSSSFEVNGTDITTPNTNGVFQLDQTTYDSNPGWAAMGASVGDFVIYSQEIDGLGTNDDMVASFKVRAYDGEDYSAESTVTVNISGVNDAPVITTAAVVNYLETDFLDNANAGIENYYKVLSAADVFAQLGIEDPDSVNIGLSLSNNSSSFEVNGTDITSGTTNGVFQLDQTTYDSNPGWAAMGASVGDFVIYSQEIDGLGTNDDMVASFKVRAYDGEDYSAESTVTVNITGVNDAPVITTAAVVNYLETDFLDNTNAGIENYYKVLSAADVFAQLGIEDPDSVNIGLSLSNNSSSFEVNGTDITSGTTNGVFQLDQATYDSNPGWATMGASVGDFVIYSQEIDGLGTNDDMVASFKVRAYDGEDYSAESTVTVNISGVNDAPVITTAAVVNYLETDFLDNANAGIENYYKVLSAADVFAQLGIEDPDSVNIGLSLSNNSSSFEVNGTDITSGTTNGVFQLDQTTYDSNPGWAAMGASVGDFVIYSQEIDGLGTNDDMVASFKVRAYDGEDYSAESTVTVNITGVNDAPVITTAAVVNYLETDFLDNTNAGIENYYKVLSAADVFAQLGIEDPDSVNIGLSLSNNSSSFEVNGTDITSGTTNGVFQLDQATYDSNPGWATMGASVGDFVIYSQEIDGLGTNDDMVASFKVRAYDGEDYSAESTVTVNISGVNDAPVITTAAVVNYLETDFLDNANAGIENYYKVLSAADVFAQLGIEDPDSVNIGLSLSNNSSSFEVNGTDITTPNTNGVFQLDQTTYDSNPGWAAMGASVGDFVIYSQEIDGLGTNDDMVASFKVRAYDGEDYSAESTVTVNISGVNDAPEVSLVEESTLLGTGLSLSDLDTITASGTDSVGETAFRVYESTTVTITTNGPTTDPVLYVFDEAGNVVATDDDSGTAAGSWYNATVTLTLAPGDYVVKFSDYPYGGTETNTNDRTGDITLSFTADKDISVYESEINTKLTVGADVDDAEVDMSALLQEASQGNTIDSLDEVDLTTGDHILSNMDVTELLSITDGDNTLKIDGDTGDKIDLDLGTQADFGTLSQEDNKWYVDAAQSTADVDAYVSSNGTDVVTLLIDKNIDVI